MKHSLILFLILASLSLQSQNEKPRLFYKISAAATLTLNEDWTISNEESIPLIGTNGHFVNATVGYQLSSRTSIGLNFQYDYFLEQDLNFFPVHFTFRYNLFDFDDKFYVRAGYGIFAEVAKDFETGSMYRAGVGFQIFMDEDYEKSMLFGLDFSRRRFGFRESEKLSSLAISLEFQLF